MHLRNVITLCLILALCAGFGSSGLITEKAEAKGFNEHGLGLLLENPEITAPGHGVTYIHPTSPELDVRSSTGPKSVINALGLPPVKSQGSQGSCTAWATAYYHRTHLEWREKQWDVNLSQHQCSPAFLYHHINGGYDTGSFISEAMDMICSMGCASLYDVPYSASDSSSWPSNTQVYYNALQFRALNYSWMYIGNDAGLANLKQHIANGGTAVLAINVYSNFDYILNYNNTYCASEVYGTNRGAHAVTVYGFDDNFSTADGPGAFRLVNSWGTGWGDNGHFWMSYVATKNSTLSGLYAYFLNDRLNYTPVLVAEARIQHSARGEVMWNGITAGIGNTSTSNYTLKILDFNYIQSYVGITNYQRYAFPDCAVPVDLTDGVNYINRSTKNNIFVKMTDALSGNTGTVNSFSATDYSWNIWNNSSEAPAQIPEGTYVFLNLTLEERILQQHTPVQTAHVGEPITIDAYVISTHNLSGIWVYYRPVNESVWYATGMLLTSGEQNNGTYTATIPAQQSPGSIEYYIYAIDSSGYNISTENYTVIVEPVSEGTYIAELLLGLPILWLIAYIATCRRTHR